MKQHRRHNHKFLRTTALVLLLMWGLPALACNFPTVHDYRQPGNIDPQQTLESLLFPNGSDTAETPVSPDTTEVPVPVPSVPEGPAWQLTNGTFIYAAQSGDTLPALAKRFDVSPGQITSSDPIPAQALIRPGQLLNIPNSFEQQPPFNQALLPDSAIVYSPASIDFDLFGYINQAGGYLSSYSEQVAEELLTGPQIVERVVLETSTNPRILLAALEYQSGWVLGQPRNPSSNYPMGFTVSTYEGLYKQLILTQRQLTIGYYGWRSGSQTTLPFEDGQPVRISPILNAGSVAVQYLFATLYRPANWENILYGENNFVNLYNGMFPNAWSAATELGPQLPPDLENPRLELPFATGDAWNLTGGPHAAWGIGSPRGAVDFAPNRAERGCTISSAWVTAAAPGLVIRSERGLVMVDLDGDGYEQTGWVIMYLHVAERDRIAADAWVDTNDPLGHPSCEGGVSTGSHVHLTRKYNGEWIAVDDPLPLILSGWQVVSGDKNYQGSLIKEDAVVEAKPGGSAGSLIVR